MQKKLEKIKKKFIKKIEPHLGSVMPYQGDIYNSLTLFHNFSYFFAFLRVQRRDQEILLNRILYRWELNSYLNSKTKNMLKYKLQTK